jgi:MFS family permease
LFYTKAGLFALFAWLLWGDFCFTLMEVVVPTVLPLKLKALGCSNGVMGIILSTIPAILNTTICPYVSFKSDRYRSRWGRRMPFIIATLPFLCLSLVLMGWADVISLFLQQHISVLQGVAPVTLTIGLIALFMAFFQFFNMFVNSVFWYLFNDVVPAQFLARFLGAFRIVGVAAGTIYNYFIFQYAESHMREIFLGAALLYFIGFGMVCLRVKEGEYPPVDGEADKDNKGWGGVRTFFRECLSHKIYWILFTAGSFTSVAGAVGIFGVFFSREMGLSLGDIGKLGAIGGAFSMIAVYVAAVFIDRWHPLRVLVYLRVFALIGLVSSWIWTLITLPGHYYFWLAMGIGLIGSFQAAFAGAAELPMVMRLFPKSRFGQFCSGQAMMQSIFRIIGGFAAGLFVDAVRWFCHGSDFAYRFNFAWITVFSAIGAGLSIWLYLWWNKLGGDFHYHPPAAWSPTKMEEMELVASVPPQSRWLNYSLHLFNAIMALSVLGLPFLMWWMHRQGARLAFHGFAVWILPLSVAAWIFWKMVEKGIRRDMECSIAGKPLHNGIPHHGVLIVISTKYLIALVVWVSQVVVAVNLNMETGAVVFGLGNVLTNFLLIGCVWLMCRVERGYSVTLDKWPGAEISPTPVSQ